MPARISPEAKSAHRSESSRKPAPPTTRRLSKTPNPPAPKRTMSANGNGHGSQANEKLTDTDGDKKAKKSKKIKLISSIPDAEYTALLGLREQFSDLGIHVKKSELVRAGLQFLTNLPISKVKTELAKIVDLKVVEPKTKK